MKGALLFGLFLVCDVAVAQTASVRVMSFNIRFDNPKDTADIAWVMRRQPCADMVKEICPDVIGMQEPRGKQYEEIIALLPDYVPFRIPLSEKVTEKNSGRIMIFYRKDKYRLMDSGYFWLTDNPQQPGYSFETTDRGNIRAALWVKLREKGSRKTFYFLTTHLPYKKAPEDDIARAKCAKLIVAKMKRIAGEKAIVFVTGDMNAVWDLRAPRRNGLIPFFEWMLSARHMSPETDAHRSFNGWRATEDQPYPVNLDHIFYRNAHPLKFRTIDEHRYGVPFISDHYPIICDFEI